jgi:hypothetical protein
MRLQRRLGRQQLVPELVAPQLTFTQLRPQPRQLARVHPLHVFNRLVRLEHLRLQRVDRSPRFNQARPLLFLLAAAAQALLVHVRMQFLHRGQHAVLLVL